jgi:hypothetical protein
VADPLFAHEKNRNSVPQPYAWFGRPFLQTTVIYANATSEEEKQLAAIMWSLIAIKAQPLA